MFATGSQAMTGLFNPPLVHINASLSETQRARGAAVLVAAQARPGCSLSELLNLAIYIYDGDTPGLLTPSLPPVFGRNQMDLDPVHADPSTFGPLRRSMRIPNFGDLDRTGEDRDRTFQGDPEEDDGLG